MSHSLQEMVPIKRFSIYNIVFCPSWPSLLAAGCRQPKSAQLEGNPNCSARYNNRFSINRNICGKLSTSSSAKGPCPTASLKLLSIYINQLFNHCGRINILFAQNATHTQTRDGSTACNRCYSRRPMRGHGWRGSAWSSRTLSTETIRRRNATESGWALTSFCTWTNGTKSVCSTC